MQSQSDPRVKLCAHVTFDFRAQSRPESHYCTLTIPRSLLSKSLRSTENLYLDTCDANPADGVDLLDSTHDGDGAALKMSTLHHCRALKRNPSLEAHTDLLSTGAGKPHAVDDFVRALGTVIERFRARLHTTAEQEAHLIEHTERVLETEKAAGKEELALENQLIVESRERERQRLHTEDAESKIKAELAVIADNTAQRAERLRLQTTAHDQETDKSFHQRQNQLVSLLKKLQDQLSKTETTHSQAEIMLRKKVSDNEKKLASNTGDYDDEVGVIQQTLTEESCIFEDTREKRMMYELGYNDLCGQKHAQC